MGKQKNTDPHFRCPECESDNLIVSEVFSYYLNTGDFFCHSVKSHDFDAQVECMSCGWKSIRGHAFEKEDG